MKILSYTNNSFDITDYVDAVEFAGYDYLEMDFYVKSVPNQSVMLYAGVYENGIQLITKEDNIETDDRFFTDPAEFIEYSESIFQDYGITCSQIINCFPVYAAKNNRFTTRDFISKLIRVKSSNVWSYAYEPRDNRMGNMLMQFKDKDGGEGDIYIYYDVPATVWKQLVGASSKGHTFWKLIRNNYRYAKLTGDKRTHLPNGI